MPARGTTTESHVAPRVSSEHVSVHVETRTCDRILFLSPVSPPLFVFHANSTGMKRIRSDRWRRTDGRTKDGWKAGLSEIYFITIHHTSLPMYPVNVHVNDVAHVYGLSFRDYSRRCILAKIFFFVRWNGWVTVFRSAATLELKMV